MTHKDSDPVTLDRGPLQTFELTWRSGHTEDIQAHVINYETNDQGHPTIIEFRAEHDGRLQLVLRATLADLRTIRNTTITETELS